MNTVNGFSGEHAFLSNFFASRLTHNDHAYATVEHAFQAAKATNEEERAKVAAAATPGAAKRLGRRVALRADWESVKVATMKEIVTAKFEQNPDLAARLLATGDARLIEANTWNDRTWGTCKGVGRNLLGTILEEVRAHLRA